MALRGRGARLQKRVQQHRGGRRDNADRASSSSGIKLAARLLRASQSCSRLERIVPITADAKSHSINTGFSLYSRLHVTLIDKAGLRIPRKSEAASRLVWYGGSIRKSIIHAGLTYQALDGRMRLKSQWRQFPIGFVQCVAWRD